jgi:hypothetical protein
MKTTRKTHARGRRATQPAPKPERWTAQPCRCGVGIEGECLVCRGWVRHYRDVQERVATTAQAVRQ